MNKQTLTLTEAADASEAIQGPEITVDRVADEWTLYEVDLDENPTFRGEVQRIGVWSFGPDKGKPYATDPASCWRVMSDWQHDSDKLILMVPPGTDPLTFEAEAHPTRWTLWLHWEGQVVLVGHYSRAHAIQMAKASIEAGGSPIIGSPTSEDYSDWDEPGAERLLAMV